MADCVILIVEDDQGALDTWSRDILEFNRRADAPFKYKSFYAKTRNEALLELTSRRIDCAVIDLRIPRDVDDETNDAVGNEVLQQLLEEVGVPAVVYSGYPAEASDEVRRSNIRVRQKQGNGGAVILNEFAEEAGLIEAMNRVRRLISKETSRLFNDSIWGRWKDSWRQGDRAVIAGVIARQTASHIADSMSLPPGFFHPDEFYIVPPLFSKRLDTGDLVQLDGQAYVVITPRCNMANVMPENLLLCRLGLTAWAELCASLKGSAKNQESAQRRIRDYATQNHATSSHFLPPCGQLGPWLADFQEVISIPSAKADALLPERIASIAPHFVPNLVQRYAAYHGRIGQPDIDTDILSKQCLNQVGAAPVAPAA